MAFGIFATNRPFLSRCGPVAVLIGIAVTQAGCFSRAASQRADSSLELSSTSVSGEIVDGRCTCDGQEKSPELSWSSAPAHTRSFTVIVVDRDSPFSLLFGPFVHWLIYNLPANTRELPEGAASLSQLPEGSLQGLNGFDKTGYAGPCAPPPSNHRYVFTLYALDTTLNLPSGASKEQLQEAMKGHVLASAELVKRYSRGWVPPVIVFVAEAEGHEHKSELGGD